jgi:hypothetical protein
MLGAAPVPRDAPRRSAALAVLMCFSALSLSCAQTHDATPEQHAAANAAAVAIMARERARRLHDLEETREHNIRHLAGPRWQCTDHVRWADQGGFSCAEYAPGGARTCEESNAFVDSSGVGARQACCACGGGDTRDSAAAHEAAGALLYDSDPTVTQGLCRNAQSWRDKDGVGCFRYMEHEALLALRASNGLVSETSGASMRDCNHAVGLANSGGVSAADACCACGGGTVVLDSATLEEQAQRPEPTGQAECHCCESGCLPASARCAPCAVTAESVHRLVAEAKREEAVEHDALRARFRRETRRREECEARDARLEEDAQAQAALLGRESALLERVAKDAEASESASHSLSQRAHALMEQIRASEDAGARRRAGEEALVVDARGEVVTLASTRAAAGDALGPGRGATAEEPSPAEEEAPTAEEIHRTTEARRQARAAAAAESAAAAAALQETLHGHQEALAEVTERISFLLDTLRKDMGQHSDRAARIGLGLEG